MQNDRAKIVLSAPSVREQFAAPFLILRATGTIVLLGAATFALVDVARRGEIRIGLVAAAFGSIALFGLLSGLTLALVTWRRRIGALGKAANGIALEFREGDSRRQCVLRTPSGTLAHQTVRVVFATWKRVGALEERREVNLARAGAEGNMTSWQADVDGAFMDSLSRAEVVTATVVIELQGGRAFRQLLR